MRRSVHVSNPAKTLTLTWLTYQPVHCGQRRAAHPWRGPEGETLWHACTYSRQETIHPEACCISSSVSFRTERGKFKSKGERNSAEVSRILLLEIDESAVSSQQTAQVAVKRKGSQLNEGAKSSVVISQKFPQLYALTKVEKERKSVMSECLIKIWQPF